MGPRAGRALDRPAHRRGGLRARRGGALGDDDAKLLDELGDVLFQVHFLALLLEERGAGSLADVAEHVHAKLVRRHPHIFGEVEVDGAGEVLRNWDAIKADRGGPRARHLRRGAREPARAAATPARSSAARRPHGFDWEHVPYEAVDEELAELREAATREERFHEVGDLLFSAVNVARKLKVDPELALRAAAERFRARVEAAEPLAASEGVDWSALELEEQDAYYDRARRMPPQ